MKNVVKYPTYILSCFLLFTALSCHHQLTPASTVTTLAPDPNASQLLFLTFRITRDTAAWSKAELINVLNVPGEISTESYAVDQNFISVSLLYSNKFVISTATVPHPLLKEMEFIKDDGTFARRSLVLKEAEFFVRMAHNPAIRYIRVTETINKVEKQIALIPHKTNY